MIINASNLTDFQYIQPASGFLSLEAEVLDRMREGADRLRNNTNSFLSSELLGLVPVRINVSGEPDDGSMRIRPAPRSHAAAAAAAATAAATAGATDGVYFLVFFFLGLYGISIGVFFFTRLLETLFNNNLFGNSNA